MNLLNPRTTDELLPFTLDNPEIDDTLFDVWEGSVITIYRDFILNVQSKQEIDEDHIICMVTSIGVGGKYYNGYSNIILQLDHIYGNRVPEHVPIDIAVETYNIGDTNKMVYALKNQIMASSCTLKGLSVQIEFGRYKLEDCIISAAKAELHPGTMGGTFWLTITGMRWERYTYDIHNLGIKHYKLRTTRKMVNNPNETYGHVSLSCPSAENGLNDVSPDPVIMPAIPNLTLSRLSLLFQENVKIIGTDTKYATIYPPYPAVVTAELIAHLIPEATMDMDTYKEHYEYPENVFYSWFEPLMQAKLFNIHTDFYGDYAIIPQNITEARQNFHTVKIDLTGTIITYSGGKTSYGEGF